MSLKAHASALGNIGDIVELALLELIHAGKIDTDSVMAVIEMAAASLIKGQPRTLLQDVSKLLVSIAEPERINSERCGRGRGRARGLNGQQSVVSRCAQLPHGPAIRLHASGRRTGSPRLDLSWLSPARTARRAILRGYDQAVRASAGRVALRHYTRLSIL